MLGKEAWPQLIKQNLDYRGIRQLHRLWTTGKVDVWSNQRMTPTGTGTCVQTEGDLQRSATVPTTHKEADITLLPRWYLSGPTEKQWEKEKSLSSHMKWKNKSDDFIWCFLCTALTFQSDRPTLWTTERTSTHLRGCPLFEAWNFDSKNVKVLTKSATYMSPQL